MAATAQSRRPDRRGGHEIRRCPLDRGAPTNRRSRAPHFGNRPEQRFLYFFIGIHPAVSDSAPRIPRRRLGLPNRQFVCQGLTLAFAPRSSAKSKSADGNFSSMVLIRLSGSLAFLSSSSKTNKIVFRK